MGATFSRESEAGLQETDGGFRTNVQTIGDSAEVDLQSILQDLNTQLDRFTNLGSGWNLVTLNNFVMHIARYRPLVGSSFIRTPDSLIHKGAIVNVNNNDNECFKWATLSAIFPVSYSSDRMSAYIQHSNKLDWTGLRFPVQLNQIRQFERNNTCCTVNVYKFVEADPIKKTPVEIIPVYITRHEPRLKHIDLLLLKNEITSHFVWIKSMSRLISCRTKKRGRTLVCPHCVHPFKSEEYFVNHFPDCSKNIYQKNVYPTGDDARLFWKARSKTELYPFVIYADFESYLEVRGGDEVEGKSNVINEHKPSGYCIYTVSTVEEYQNPPIIYSGVDCMEHFFDALLIEQRRISCILGVNFDMLPLTRAEELDYTSSTHCKNCDQLFTTENNKCRHHRHDTGKYVSTLCNKCNMQIKPRRRKYWRPLCNLKEPNSEPKYNRYPQESENFEFQIHIPVCYHGLSNYDAHHIFRYFNRRVITLFDNKVHDDNVEDDKIKSMNVQIIALNLERFVSFELLNLRFIDTVKFLNSSLETLVVNLSASCCTPHDLFIHTRRNMGDNKLLFAKGVFPYEYFNSLTKFSETKLPSIDCFYSRLNEESISVQDYERAQHIWETFHCKTLQDYHDHYLKTDVLLLADVFEQFRRTGMEYYKLDPAQYLTLPSFSWDALLKYTKIELELISDPEMFLFFEKGIRGGISVISHRHALANNPYIKATYDFEKEVSYIAFLDANNLYGWAMSQYLPIADFKFLSQQEIENADFIKVPIDAKTGYVIECDLQYPTELHNAHNDYPLAPENVLVTESMLSPFCKSFGQKHVDCQKLIPNLYDKRKYVLHYRNLQLYISLGMKIIKIHRVASFTQSLWMKPYVDFNTEKRQQARNEFEKNFFKLMVNAIFGKSMENVRAHTTVNLVSDPIKFLKMVSKPQIKQFSIVNEDTVLVERMKAVVTLNKPIYTGFCVLDLSKLLMYNFHYNVMRVKYGDEACLLFTDTDSLCYSIKTQDFYQDMGTMIELFDTSEYPVDHPLFSHENAKVLGKMKDECFGKPAIEFVGLRSKMYSLLSDMNKPAKMTAKGIKRAYVKKHLRHEMYLKTLLERTCTHAQFMMFRTRHHRIETVQFYKKCLAAYDDKRYVQDDGIRTLAYGHYSLNVGFCDE
jgi:hypothetical protein